MKVLLFDLMDTLVIEPYHTIDAQMAEKELMPNWLKENLHPEQWQAIKLQSSGGKISQKDLFYYFKDREKFHKFERNCIDEREFFSDFYSAATPPSCRRLLPEPHDLKRLLLRQIQPMPNMLDRYLPSLLTLARQEPQHVCLGIASNYSQWAKEILHQFPILQQLDYHFFSYELGFRKPEQAYYRAIMHRLASDGILHSDADATNIFFVDDRLSNVESAQSVGWKTFHFCPKQDKARILSKELIFSLEEFLQVSISNINSGSSSNPRSSSGPSSSSGSSID